MADGESNSKVAWYDVIRENLKDIKTDMADIKKTVGALDDKLDKIYLVVERHDGSIITNKDEINRLRSASNRWDAIIGIVMLVLSALGLTKS